MSETKVCKHCKVDKSTNDYQKAGGGKWLQPYCKPCDKERKRLHSLKNQEYLKEKRKKYYEDNKESILGKQREYNQKKPKKGPKVYVKMPIEEYKRRKSECDKRYRENNKEKIQANKKQYQESGRATETAKAWQKRMMDKVEFRMKKNLRGRIYVALKRGCKSDTTINLLGCSLGFFKDYFESKFTEGMNWDAYMKGGIHIDHIIPCKKFDLTKEEEQRKCFHYTNLQPLWELDNLKKGVKLMEELCQIQ